MLWWRMKSDVTDVYPYSQRHAKGLNSAIQVLVIQGVLVVPNSSRWVGHLVAHKPNAIVPRIGLDLSYRCACTRPGDDGRPRSHRVANRGKREIGSAAHTILTIGGVVIHVTLPRMSLAPGVFVRSDILGLGEIGRPWIERCVQITNLNQNAV